MTTTTKTTYTEEDKALILSHPAIFLDTLGFINDPNDPAKGGFKWTLWPWQWVLLDTFLTNQRVITLKARQLGVSWLLAGYAIWTFLARPGSVTLLISRREAEAMKLLSKAVYIYDHLPREFLPPSHKKDSNTGLRLFSQYLHSEIQALPATPDTGRSETATLVIPDEWAIQEYAAEMYAGYEPTVGQMGQIIGASTAKGPGGFFYDIWQGAKTRENGFISVFLPWHLRPDRTVEWREQKRKEYERAGTPELLGSEYPEDELEAWESSSTSVFPNETVRLLLSQITRPISTRTEPNGSPWLYIYTPARYTAKYVIGSDIAEGTGKDFSTAVVMDAQTGVHVASARMRISPDLWASRLAELGDLYNHAMIAPEKNYYGISTIGALLALGYDNIYRRPKQGKNPQYTREDYGWLTTLRTKPDMIVSFRQALSEGSFITTCQWLINELPYFRKDGEEPGTVSYNAAPGFHDDMIIAAGIAWMTHGSVRGTVRRRSYKTRALSR